MTGLEMPVLPVMGGLVGFVEPVLPPLDAMDSWNCNLEMALFRVFNLNRAKSKDPGWTLVVKVFVLGTDCVAEATKVLVTSLNQLVDLRLTLSVSIASCQDIDNLVHFPLLVNFYEHFSVLAKDKKKLLEEKLELIGQVSVDALPLVKGSVEVKGSWIIFPTVSQSAVDVMGEPSRCDLLFRVTNSIVPPFFSDKFNILTVNLHGCHSFPEAWVSNLGTKSAIPGFTLVTAVPKTADQKRFLVASSNAVLGRTGTLLAMKKWPAHPAIVSDAIYRQESMQPKNYSKELGDFCDPVNWTDRHDAERRLPYLPINTEFRCVLSKDAEQIFLSRAVDSQVLPFEIFQMTHLDTKHAGTKKKGNIEGSSNASDEPVMVRHGIALVNLKPLLYPGATSITGAYSVKSYETSQLNDSLKNVSFGTEVLKSSTFTLIKAAANAQPQKEQNRLSVASKKVLDRGSSFHSDHHGNKNNQEFSDGQHTELSNSLLYEDSGTYVYLEITLDKPLIEKKLDTEIIDRLKKLIFSTENANSNSESNSKSILEKFSETVLQDQMEAMCRLFAQIFSEEKKRLDSKSTKQKSEFSLEKTKTEENFSFGKNSTNQIRQKIELRLTESGDFQTLKKEMKFELARFVQEKFSLTKPFINSREYDQFLSDLYLELTQHLQVIFRNMERHCHRPPFESQPRSNLQDLRTLAMEAELDDEFSKAENFFLERISFSPTDSVFWKVLGSFYLRFGKIADAEIAFKKILLKNFADFDGLLLNGYVQMEKNNLQKAEIFFEAAVAIYPNSALAWFSFAVFNEIKISNRDGIATVSIEAAYKEANRASGLDEVLAKKYEIFLAAVAEEDALETAAVAASTDVPVPGKNQQKTTVSAVSSRPKTDSKTKKDFKILNREQMETDKQRGEFPRFETVFRPLNFIFPVEKKIEKKIENIFEFVVCDFVDLGMHKMTNVCVDRLIGSSCDVLDPVFCRSVLSSFIQQRRFRDAEFFLKKIFLFDVETSDFFAIFGHVKYLQGDYEEAAENYRRALCLPSEISDLFVLYFRFGRISEIFGFHKKAKKMFFLAAKIHPTCRTWLGCGRACYQLGEYELAETILQEANNLDNRNPQVWGYLTMASAHFGRVEETERCYQAAKVFGIAAFPPLLEEIETTRTQLRQGTLS